MKNKPTKQENIFISEEEKTINFVDNIVLSNIFLVKTNNEENPIISNASNIVASVIKK